MAQSEHKATSAALYVALNAVKYGSKSVVVLKAALIILLVLSFVLLLATTVIGAFGSGTGDTASTDSSASTGGEVATPYAKKIIPARMLTLYQSASVKKECPGLSWTVVAAIIHLESADNRNPGVSSAGARGASQFMPTTWDRQGRHVVHVTPYGRVKQGYAMDGDGDGLADIMNPKDSVPATARMICANGGGKKATLPKAVYAYNHAWWYVNGGVADNGHYFVGILPLSKKLGTTVAASDSGVWVLPIAKGSYGLTAPFGRCGKLWSHCHTGQDFSAPTGTKVRAATTGTITSAAWAGPYGNRIIVKSGDGTETWYCHLSAFVKKDGPVAAGTVIGLVGATGNTTGPHLHFEVRPHGGKAINPMPYLRARGLHP